MIDSIKIRIDGSPSRKGLEWAGKFPLRDSNRGTAMSYRLYNEARTHYLRVKVYENSRTIIEGSIRKWYLGKKTFKDLDNYSFKNAIELVAKKLGFTFDDLLWAKVSSFEFGANIRVQGYELMPILQSILEYPRLTWNFRPNSRYFVGTIFEIKFYDKLLQMAEKEKCKAARIIWNKEKCSKILRFEIRYKKVSKLGYRLGDLRKVKDLLDNWNSLIDDWENCLYNFTFDNSLEISEMDFGSMTVKEHRNFVEQKGAEQIGYRNLLDHVTMLKASSSHKSQYRKVIKKRYANLMEMNELNTPEWILKMAVQEKANEKRAEKN